MPREVERRRRPVAEHVAYGVVPLAEQEAFLAAIEDCASHCPSAEPLAAPDALSERGDMVRSSAPGREKQEQFADTLARVLLTAFARVRTTSISACRGAWSVTLWS